MNKGKQSILSRYATWFYFGLLFLLLLACYSRTFGNPPRSDYWSVSYVFHQVDASSGPPTWLDIANHDPWRHGTFRPLAHLILYLEHEIFGANFSGNHIFNFLCYFLSLVLLYLLARSFALDKILTGTFLLLFAFLFSHFDIITWTFHVFTIISFCAFLFGFIIFLKFLKTGRTVFLIPIVPLFIFGMLCSEVYALWPLALLILSYAPHLTADSRKGRRWPVWALLGAIYLVYLLVLLFTREAAHTTGKLPHPTIAQVAVSACGVLFNLFYTGILVNLIPALGVPARVYDNIDMGGLLIRWAPRLPEIVAGTGIAMFLLIGLSGWLLHRRKKFHALSLLGFLLYLYCSSFFVVVLARATTNTISYVFTQFRYQFIPNAIVILLAVAALDTVLRPRRREKLVIAAVLIPILLANIYISQFYVAIIQEQLRPLRLLISQIRGGIKDGVINRDARLYLEDGLAGRLPALCWNRTMAPFVRGTYQWMFSGEELSYFTFSIQDAAWIIRADDYKNIWKLNQRQK